MMALLMGLKTVAPSELARLLETGAAIAIDVNAPQSWRRARVPGALNLDHLQFRAEDLPTGGAALVFYCSNHFCRKAPLAARRALTMGQRDVRVLSAGISGWVAADLPTEAG